ncbi:MAG: hypothetical protein JRF33_25750 [Deltaproteobacteria bacterium]|nr:hypothetical protein [Deltaproteobacteria bacterium]
MGTETLHDEWASQIFKGLPVLRPRNFLQSPENREIDIQYDDLQRVFLKTFTQDNVVEGSNTYTYDSSPEYGLGRLHIADSEAGQATYQYKPRGQVARYEFSNATTQNTYVVQYGYNDAGSTKAITYPDGLTYSYDYFPNGSPHRLYRPGYILAQRAVFIDPADGLETTELLLEDGTMSRRSKRDDSGRLLSLLSETVSPQALIMERNLNYYANGKIQQIIDVETPRTSNYGYDSLMRLSEWSDSQYQQFETYSFLNGGTPNPKLQSVVNNTTTLSFSYGDSGFPWAVTQIVDNGAQSTKTLSYDEDGIVHVQSVNGYNTTHTYNAQGLVKQVSQLFSNRQWEYNHKGAVATIQATTGLWPPVTTTTELLGNLYERITTNGWSVAYRHHHFAGQRIARTTVGSSNIRYYHGDERGSVRYATDGNGTVTANFDYKPYGDEFTSNGSSTFRFNDRRDDGYDQLRFPLRMLNKTTYHWTALDPKVLTQPAVLLLDGANPFVYCMYDPVNRSDVDGGASQGAQKAIARARGLKPSGPPIPAFDTKGANLWDAIGSLFSSSNSSDSDETKEKEGEPEGKKKQSSKKPAKKNTKETAGWPATKYDTKEQAMKDVGPRLNARGEGTKWEHRSFICQHSDGKWVSEYPRTIAKEKKVTIEDIDELRQDPGIQDIHVIHNHNHVGNNHVSKQDRATAWAHEVIIYVSGNMGIQCYTPDFNAGPDDGTYTHMRWNESTFTEGSEEKWYGSE